jgi:hypothetical protein
MCIAQIFHVTNPLEEKTMSTPTPQQIALVKENLKNMQKLNDYIYTNGLARLASAYLLLSQNDNSDPGLNYAVNVLEGAFWAIGSEAGPIGNFAASFMSGMVSSWTSSTPPSLSGQFANYYLRFQATGLQVDKQLATYHQNVEADWNTPLTYNGQTTTLSDLTAGEFPKETDPTFETMAANGVQAVDQGVWKQMLVANDVVTQWFQSSGTDILPNSQQSSPPTQWAWNFIQQNPSWFITWEWHNSSGCGDSTGWLINQFSLGPGGTDVLSSDACQHLFTDLNAQGLYDRATVFTNLGIRQTTGTVGNGGGGGAVADRLSMSYLRAMKQGKTLGMLIEREGRKAVESRVIQKAHEDSIFANRLAFSPRETLEKFLDVKIPDTVSVSVIVENGRTYGLVIPRVANDESTIPEN